MVDLDFDMHPEQSCPCGNDAGDYPACLGCGGPVCETCQDWFAGICLDCAEKEAEEPTDA